MENKRDLRYQKADKKIKTEFVKLLKTKGYQKITVSQIIKVANVNRSTFYNHYLDKDDLIEHLQVELIQNLTMNLPELTVADIDNHQAIKNRINQLIQNIYKNRKEVKLYFSPKSDGLFSKRYSDFLEQLIIRSDIPKLLKIPDIYAFSAMESVIISILVTWVNRDFLETPDQISEIISRISPNLFKSIIN